MGADVELLKKSFSKGLHLLKLMRAVLGVPGKKEKKKGQLLPPLNQSKTPDFKLFVTLQGVMFS